MLKKRNVQEIEKSTGTSRSNQWRRLPARAILCPSLVRRVLFQAPVLTGRADLEWSGRSLEWAGEESKGCWQKPPYSTRDLQATLAVPGSSVRSWHPALTALLRQGALRASHSVRPVDEMLSDEPDCIISSAGTI